MPRRDYRLLAVIILYAAAGLGAWSGYRHSPFLGAGIFLCGAACTAALTVPGRPIGRRCLAGLLLSIGLPNLLTGGHQLRCWYQPRPEPIREPLFRGVEYIREVLTDPRPSIVHLLKVDLKTPGVRVLVTPPDFPDQLQAVRARTTSQFVAEFRVQAAINASSYFPFERRNPLTYWPYGHEPKGIVGGAASDGVPYGEPNRSFPVLHVTPDNHAAIVHGLPRPWHTATAGVKHFIINGRPIPMSRDTPDAPIATGIEAATAVGIDVTGTILFLVVTDGEQPPYSFGVARPALTELLLRHGVHNALGMDGGGSSAMVVADASGTPCLLSRPVQGTVPGWERPVGNHIGIFAPALEAP